MNIEKSIKGQTQDAGPIEQKSKGEIQLPKHWYLVSFEMSLGYA